jgi:hypothetical protein
VTDLLCVTCPVLRPNANPRRPNNPQVCDGCRDRLGADLAALPDAYALVDTESGRAAGELRASGFESRPPLNITALSLLGPGSDTPPAKLDAWVQDWATYRRTQLPPPSVYAMCAWLAEHLPWACDEHPAIDEFAGDIRDLVGELRAFTGKDRGESVGRCPRKLGDSTCDTPLFVDPYVDEIQCSRCRMTWKRRAGEWMHLRAQQMTAGVEAVA